MPVKAPYHSFSILHLTGMRRRRALPGTLPPDQESTWKGGTEKWTLVAEYHTASGMATDVPDVVDAMYHHVAEYMHAGDLRMDDNNVGSPIDFHMCGGWCRRRYAACTGIVR